MRQYISVRGDYEDNNEQFFVHRDKTPVTAMGARNVLRLCLENLNLDPEVYNMHSLKIGRTSDLVKYNYSFSEVQKLGRWTSNCVFKYIRN